MVEVERVHILELGELPHRPRLGHGAREGSGGEENRPIDGSQGRERQHVARRGRRDGIQAKLDIAVDGLQVGLGEVKPPYGTVRPTGPSVYRVPAAAKFDVAEHVGAPTVLPDHDFKAAANIQGDGLPNTQRLPILEGQRARRWYVGGGVVWRAPFAVPCVTSVGGGGGGRGGGGGDMES